MTFTLIIIALVIIIAIIAILHTLGILMPVECPICGNKRNNEKEDEIYLGDNFSNNRYSKSRAYYNCGKCNHKWSEIKDIEHDS